MSRSPRPARTTPRSPLEKAGIILIVAVSMLIALGIALVSVLGSLMALSHDYMYIAGHYLNVGKYPFVSILTFVVGIVGGPAYFGYGLIAIDRVLSNKE